MKRFFKIILFNLHLVVYYTITMHKYSKSKNVTNEFKYDYARKIVHLVTRKSKTTVKSYGLDNIPSESGYLMLGNHQGKFDALGIIESHNKPLSVVIEKKVCTNPLLNNFLTLTDSVILDKENLRSVAKSFKQIENEIVKEKNYLIFPEGKYEDNHNELQEFQTGCLKFLYKTHSTIVPICLYDTYKVFGTNSLKPVTCEIHYLKPILYSEYKDLSKVELAELVKSRIQEKLDEIKNRKD